MQTLTALPIDVFKYLAPGSGANQCRHYNTYYSIQVLRTVSVHYICRPGQGIDASVLYLIISVRAGYKCLRTSKLFSCCRV